MYLPLSLFPSTIFLSNLPLTLKIELDDETQLDMTLPQISMTAPSSKHVSPQASLYSTICLVKGRQSMVCSLSLLVYIPID